MDGKEGRGARATTMSDVAQRAGVSRATASYVLNQTPGARIPEQTRAMLALFCYRRAHLQSLSIAIASTCSEIELLDAGGRAGAVLFELSRKQEKAAATVSEPGGRKISLASGPLWTPAPLEDDYED